MTAPRRRQKATAFLTLVWTAAVAVLVAGLPAGPARAGMSSTEQVVMELHSGLAISGYDPVGYFTEGTATEGRAEYEYSLAGATWRFRNAGNLGAFMARPDIYMPRFGGYDPVGAARGVAVAGNPDHWMIVNNRLYLFYDGMTLAAFTAEPARFIESAERKWPTVLRELSP
jgi:hypothetical protein